MKTAIIKTLLLSATITAGATSTFANASEPDTTLTVENVQKVIITEDSKKSTITLVYADSIWSHTVETPANRQSNSRTIGNLLSLSAGKPDDFWKDNDLIITGPGIGFCVATGQPAGMKVEPGKSIEVNWLYALGYERRVGNGSLSTGIGFAWRNYRMTQGQTFVPENGTVDIGSYPETVTPRYSRLKTFSIQVPILWRQWFLKKKFFGTYPSITFGPVLNFNTYGSLKNGWVDENGAKQELFYKNIGQKKFTVDLFMSLRFFELGSFYVRYSPFDVLEKPYGQTAAMTPKFKSLSAGFLFCW